jgi:peroxin-5
MLEKWIDLGEGVVAGEGTPLAEVEGVSLKEGRDRLVERLIGIARRKPEDVEADVQVALGVLFNASEVSASWRFNNQGRSLMAL